MFRSFKYGNEYEIKTIENGGKSVYIKSDTNFEAKTMDGLRFMFGESVGESKNFFDYFVTLAEWRDKQIDKILNDE
jgi:hypothetical protein